MVTIEETIGQIIANHRQEIVDKAVDKLATRLAKTCLPEAEKQFRQGVEAAIRQRAGELVSQLDTTTFYVTDCHGQRRSGKPGMTLTELFVATVRSYLHEKVDEDGRSGTDAHGSRNITRLQFIVSEAARQCVAADLDPVIKAAKEEFKEQIGVKLATVFRDTLAAAMKSSS